MSTKVFVNLPVKDLERSKAYWQKLGYSFNPQFTDDKAGCMVVSDTIYAMLITEPFFKTFTPKPIADAKTSTEVLVALSFESRAAVDEFASIALANGAKEARPAQDHGFMYQRSIEDIDGHIWEPFWMNASHVQSKT